MSKIPIYRVIYSTLVSGSDIAIVAANHEGLAELLLKDELKSKENRNRGMKGIVNSFKAYSTVDTGYKSDKEGVIYF